MHIFSYNATICGLADLYLCGAVSGDVPEEPVVSKKSGLLYEKRLIERHISVCLFFSSFPVSFFILGF